jgi:HAMP domain-containing protein
MNTQNTTQPKPQKLSGPGSTIFTKLMRFFMSLIIIFGIALTLVYQSSISTLIEEQAQIRAESITRFFASTVLPPLAVRDYLRVNKIAEATAELPDVAYAVAVNNKGTVIAGVFGDLTQFDPALVEQFQKQGFPPEILAQTKLASRVNFNKMSLQVGGRKVTEYAMRLGNAGMEVHVGILVDNLMPNSYWALIQALSLLVITIIISSIMLFRLAYTLVMPIHKLREHAEAIAEGKFYHEIVIKSSGELWQLVEAFKRMQKTLRETFQPSDQPFAFGQSSDQASDQS